MKIRRLTGDSFNAALESLANLIVDAVANGASVNFMAGFDAREARAWWLKLYPLVADGSAILLVAETDAGAIIGTVHARLDTPPNQLHRADICKMLVHSAARNQGIGMALMQTIEGECLAAGRTLLTLDTGTPEAARLYERAGFQVAGTIPDFAKNPDGSPCDSTFYWKRLG